MAAYSLDLRERIVEAVERRMSSKRKIAEWFGVHESFLYKLLRQKRDRGDWLRAAWWRGGGETCCRAVTSLAALVAATPDATREELREQLKKKVRVEVSRSTICRRFARVRVDAKKKTKRAPQADPHERAAFKSTNQRWEGKELISWTNSASTWRWPGPPLVPHEASGRQ